MVAPRKSRPPITLTSKAARDTLSFRMTVELDPLMSVIAKHVSLSPSKLRIIRQDLMQVLGAQPKAAQTSDRASAVSAQEGNEVLTTEQAAELAGVSRPYIVRHIDNRDIALHQMVGNQRRVLRKNVLAWMRRERAKQRKALKALGESLDDEIFA